MKKTLSLVLALIILLFCLVGCSDGDKYNREQFYGVVRFSEESNQLVVYNPKFGDVAIPANEGCCSCFDGHEENDDHTYQLKAGDLIKINFKYEKSWNDHGVQIMECYPGKFDRKAGIIEVLRENITFSKNDSGYVLSFLSTDEIESAETGDTLYFVQHGGENGRAYRKLYATGEITEKVDGIIIVALTIPEGEAEFLDYYTSMTVELTWGD